MTLLSASRLGVSYFGSSSQSLSAAQAGQASCGLISVVCFRLHRVVCELKWQVPSVAEKRAFTVRGNQHEWVCVCVCICVCGVKASRQSDASRSDLCLMDCTRGRLVCYTLWTSVFVLLYLTKSFLVHTDYAYFVRLRKNFSANAYKNHLWSCKMVETFSKCLYLL